MATVAQLNAEIGVNIQPLQQGLAAAEQAIQGFSQDVATSVTSASTAIDTANSAVEQFSEEVGTWAVDANSSLGELYNGLDNLIALQSRLPESSANYAELGVQIELVTAQIGALEAAAASAFTQLEMDQGAADAAAASFAAIESAEIAAAAAAEQLAIAEKNAGIFMLNASQSATVLAERDVQLAIAETAAAKAAAEQAAMTATAEKNAGVFTQTTVGSTVATVSLAGAATAAGTALSFLRQAAYLIPGIGLAGIMNLIAEGVMEAAKDMGILSNNVQEVALKSVSASSNISDLEQNIKKLSETEANNAAKAGILIDALGSTNISLTTRKQILNDLERIAPQYLSSLDKEKASYQDISKAIGDYNSNIGKQVVIKSLLPEYEKIVKRLTDAQAEIFRLQNNVGQLNIGGILDEENASEIKRQELIVQGATKELAVAKEFLQRLAGSPIDLMEILFGKGNTGANTKTSADKISNVLSKLKTDLQSIQTLGTANKSPLGNIQAAEINAIESAIKRLIELGYSDAGIKKLLDDIKEIRSQMMLPLPKDPYLIPYAEYSASTEKLLNLSLALRDESQRKEAQNSDKRRKQEEKDLQTSLKKREEMYKQFSETIANFFGQIAVSLGEALGNVISGQEDPLKGLKESLGQSIKQLGAQLIQFAIEMAIVQKVATKLAATPAGPIILIGAGIALTAIGSAIANSSITPHAEGGIFTGPTLIGNHLFGEKGPEALIPLNGAPNMFRGESASLKNGDIVGRISGNDLLLVINRQDQYNQRNYGEFVSMSRKPIRR